MLSIPCFTYVNAQTIDPLIALDRRVRNSARSDAGIRERNEWLASLELEAKETYLRRNSSEMEDCDDHPTRALSGSVDMDGVHIINPLSDG